MNISQEIFRAYDIRGVVGKTLTVDVVQTIGLAIGSEAQDQQQSQIIVARDGRLSANELSQALIKGLTQSGCDVIDIGAVPTGVLYFATCTLNASSGVMLTGSHNPADYNGLKIVIAGKTLAAEQIQALYQRIQQQDFTHGSGNVVSHDIITDYLKAVTDDIQLQRPLNIVIDCGNGIAGHIAPTVFKKLGCKVTELYCDVDGRFPNHHPDPSEPKNLVDLIKTVKQQHADLGLAFDGDGDRVGVVTSSGNIIWADRQMMLFAKQVLAKYPGSDIIFDVKCTTHLPKFIEKHGGNPLMWKTGHSLIKAKMQELNVPLAGEMSGHVFFNDRWYGVDDGLYVAARLLEILSQDPRDADTIFAELPDSINTPEIKIAMSEAEKFTFMQQLIAQGDFADGKVTTIDGLRVDYDDGWGLIRPSNTTPFLICRFEADSQQRLDQIKTIFTDQIRKVQPNLTLPPELA